MSRGGKPVRTSRANVTKRSRARPYHRSLESLRVRIGRLSLGLPDVALIVETGEIQSCVRTRVSGRVLRPGLACPPNSIIHVIDRQVEMLLPIRNPPVTLRA